ncbi:MAG TPA: alpha/beta fold hydrolase [Solirubrobacteraceae bacterium]|nr:alpha/beta fold hydrolase [Solirubrobacteraceae bacterium]
MRLLLLHGFTATGRSWDPVRRLLDAQRYPDVVAPDLRAASIPAQVAALRQQAPYALAGYSLGGRIALHLALAQPDLVRRLVLVSTTAGIEDPGERAERRAADERLAAEIERDGVEAFAERWAAQPLFADQPPEVAAAAREDRLRHAPEQLAAALRGLGTGVMEPVWHRLGELTMPAVVLAGGRDAKFRALGERLAAALPRGELRVVPGAGHAVHLEAPEAVAAAL